MTEKNPQPALSDEQIWLLQRLAITTGLLLIVVALLVDPLGLSGEGLSGGQRLIILVGLVLAVAGFLGKHLPSAYKTLGILLLNTLVLLVCIEITAGFVSKLISSDENDSESTEITGLQGFDHPQYVGRDWADTYWSEMQRFQVEYAPYLVWNHVQFSGETLNIHADGNRETPGAECDSSDAYRVFMFGGSTMWGYGAPDAGTIPAYFQTALSDAIDQPVCVINFGRTAYVSTQELLQFIFELRAGHIPDAVIFYDGINDVYAAYQSGEPTHQNQPQIIKRLYPDETEQSFLERLREELINKTYAFNLANRWLNSESEDSPSELITYKTMGVNTEELAAEVAAVYLENYDFVRVLGESYDFDMYFFWQPALIVQPEPLTQNEQDLLTDLDPARVDLYRATDAVISEAVAKHERLHLYDVSRVFTSEDFWIDDMHIVPEGNQIIAEAMLDVFQPIK